MVREGTANVEALRQESVCGGKDRHCGWNGVNKGKDDIR